MSQIKILLTGEGGQGIQTIAKVLTDAATNSGHNVSYIPSFGVEQRGTPSTAFITFSKTEINYPRFNVADYVVILQERAIHVAKEYISPNSKVIFDSSTINVSELPKLSTHLFATPATKYAYEQFTPQVFNIIIAAKLANILNLNKEKTWESVAGVLGKKFHDEKVRKANADAFEFGWNVVFEVKTFTEPTFSPSTKKVISKGFNKSAEIVPSRCKGCGICIEKCPVKALKFSSILGVFATPTPEIDREKCIACDNCNRFCPDGAINVQKDNTKNQ
jgi:2-oxoglutarate ferredoxin oxidoreductase subunit gamma